MNAIDAAVEPSDGSAHCDLETALKDIATATSFYDFEEAWTSGLRMVSASGGGDARDRILAAAGQRLRSFGELQDDVARRGWLRHFADEVRLRRDARLGCRLADIAAAELREAFAGANGDLSELRQSVASGEGLNEFAARRPRQPIASVISGASRNPLPAAGCLRFAPKRTSGSLAIWREP